MAGALTAAIAAAFAGSSVVTDDYFEYTTLLLPGSGTNGAQNNTFLDGSTNNFTITRNGNTTQGTFSPFSQTGWGNYFNGSSYLSATGSAATQMGTGAFTWECWCYILGTSSYQGFIDTRTSPSSGSATGIGLFLNTGTLTPIATTTGTILTSSINVTANSWNHVALTRSSGGTLTIWVNGSSGGTVSNSSNLTDTSIWVGGNSSSPYPAYVNGYLSNVRMTKGADLYTTPFTPPTSPLTTTVSSGTVSLLTCQSNRFRDASSNNFTITPNGSPTVVAFSPFNPTASWSAATNGGSGYFDGSGDYLTLGGQSAFVFGTGDFTIEMFAYVTNTANTIFDLRPSTPSGAYITIYMNGGVIYYYANGANQINGGTLPLNQWVHIVASRVSSNTRLFINGVQAGLTYSDTTNYTTSGSRPIIGADGNVTGSSPMIGYLSNLRVVKGSGVTSVTVPTAPLTAITNTSLLLNFTNAGIYDATSKNDLETVADAKISTAVNNAFGANTGVMAFDGNGDYLTNNNASNPLISLGSGDFTVEGWIYANTVAGERGFLQISDTVGGLKTSYTTGIHFALGASPYRLNFNVGGTDVSSGSTYIAINTWYHIAATRSSGSVRLFINGTLVGGPTTVTTDLTGQYICVGGYYNTSFLWNGYIQDLRITKGYARYTANFTPPTQAFQTL